MSIFYLKHICIQLLMYSAKEVFLVVVDIGPIEQQQCGQHYFTISLQKTLSKVGCCTFFAQ